MLRCSPVSFSLKSLNLSPRCLCPGIRPFNLSPPSSPRTKWTIASSPTLTASPSSLDNSWRRRIQIRTFASESKEDRKPTKRPIDNIYTIPNLITIGRMIACPFIGYAVLHDDFHTATWLLAAAGISDLVDGYLARRFGWQSVAGTIIDPAADKLLMTVMTVSLAMKDLLPLPVAILIIGRDVALSIAAFWIRFRSLPPPKTFHRYWDFSIPSAEVHPTQISKYNTFLQLGLVGFTTVSQIIPMDLSFFLTGLQWTVAGTTIWSGMSYIFSKSAVKYIK